MNNYEELIDKLYDLEIKVYGEGLNKGVSYKNNKDMKLLQEAIDIIRKYNQQLNPPKPIEMKPNTNYFLKFDTEIWDIEQMCNYMKMLEDYYPETGFTMLTKNDEIKETTANENN